LGYHQPIGLAATINRIGDNARTVANSGISWCANGAGDQPAQQAGCDSILESGYFAHHSFLSRLASQKGNATSISTPTTIAGSHKLRTSSTIWSFMAFFLRSLPALVV
jgi:hypothetical protein